MLWGIVALFVFWGPLSQASPSNSNDSRSCQLWIEYFGLQEQLFTISQRKLQTGRALITRMKDLEGILFSEEAEPAVVFLPAQDWNPESERQENQVDEADLPPPSPHYSLEQRLAALESYLAERSSEEFSHEAVDAVFRRMIANRLYRKPNLQRLLTDQGIEDASLQVLILELASHEMRRDTVIGPPTAERIQRFAKVLTMPSPEALELVDYIDFSMRVTGATTDLEAIREIIISISQERLNLPVRSVAGILKRTFTQEKNYPVYNFGKLVNFILGTRDELYPIHDAETLERFLQNR